MYVKKKLILASGSPRRRLLLSQIGLDIEVCQSGIHEEFDLSKSPEYNVQKIALKKAQSVIHLFDDAIIIGADTIVVQNGNILGKPVDSKEAKLMLHKLSGKIHTVYTGFALVDCPTQKWLTSFEKTLVKFRELSSEEIEQYVKSGSPMDKAGAYGIQDDYGAVFVEKIDGCFYNVVGFPLAQFYKSLKEFQKQLGFN